jgi:hypothetical protein
MRYYRNERRARRQSGCLVTLKELRNDLLNRRKFYRVQLNTVNPLQTGTFSEEGYGRP